MQKLAVEDLRDGMILAEPILDAVGRTLLGKGEALTTLYINRLEKWGIYEVWVATVVAAPANSAAEMAAAPAAQGSDDPNREAIAAVDARIERRFAGVDGDERMDVIRSLARKHLIRQATGEKRPGASTG